MKYRERTLRIPIGLWQRIEALQAKSKRPGSPHQEIDMDAYLEFLLGSAVESYERKAEKEEKVGKLKDRLVLLPEEAAQLP